MAASVTKPDSAQQPAKPRRRWYQFSLRTAGIGIFLLCVLLGSFAWWRDRAERQRKVVKQLRGMGATVGYRWYSIRKRDKPNEDEYGAFYDSQEEFFLCSLIRQTLGDDYVYSVGEVELRDFDNPIDPERTRSALPLLQRCPHIKELWLEGNAVSGGDLQRLPCLNSVEFLSIYSGPTSNPTGLLTDHDMAVLGRATRLKWLILKGQPIGDAGVQRLSEIRSLLDLDLGHTHITDKGLQNLSGLSNLVGLDLSGTEITDEGFCKLKLPDSLRVLQLDATRLTDASIDHLQALPALTLLNVQETQVTFARIKQFEASHPNCQLWYSLP